MKIVSLNINSFGGDGESFFEMRKNLARKDYGGNLTKSCCDDALSRWDCAINCRSICESILELVNEMDADIILFQEYYINSDAAKQFQEEIGCEDKDGKYVLKCNHNKNKQPLYTVAFCRDNNAYEEVKPQFDFDGRVFVFKYEDFVTVQTPVS